MAKHDLPERKRAQGDPLEIAGFDPEANLPNVSIRKGPVCNKCHGRGYTIVAKVVNGVRVPVEKPCSCNS